MKDLLPSSYKEIQACDLKVPKAISFYETLLNIDYSEYISAHKDDNGNELIVYETQPEIDQNPKYDIRYKEKLFVIFYKSDEYVPSVFSLREDFPDVPHLNATEFKYPKFLCIYEEAYHNLKHQWTSIKFIERIREWLSLTSRGELHQEDQPLEPFMLNIGGRVLLPKNYSSIGKDLSFYLTNNYKNLFTVVGLNEKDNTLDNKNNNFIILDHQLKPQIHNVIAYAPKNIYDLNQLLKNSSVEFIEDILKPSLKKHINFDNPSNFDHKVIIILDIPKLRDEQDRNPVHEKIGFIFLKTLEEICKKVNLIIEAADQIGFNLFGTFSDEEVKSLEIFPLSIYTSFSPEKASSFNGINEPSSYQSKIAMIGCGALGSQIFMNLSRAGYYKWKLIDDDILLPHNLARHTLDSFNLGRSKSESLAFITNALLNENEVEGIQDNYLRPLDQERITGALTQVDLILDISASVPVARKLSKDKEISSRKVSMFLNPLGTDLVILAEPKDKNISLTELEACYYRSICEEAFLHSHISFKSDKLRYSISCRDVSVVMEQDNIAILAGIASKVFKQIQNEPDAKIGVWRIQKNGEVNNVSFKGEHYKLIKKNGWVFRVMDSLIKKMKDTRESKLPRETGGILIGMVDFEDKTTYLVDSILSPPDSLEYPTAYYRGIQGVKKRLEEIHKWTSGNLIYLGEWHSHPINTSLNMSNDDKDLFKWINDHMSIEGYPPLMIIIGDGGRFEIYNEIEQ